MNYEVWRKDMSGYSFAGTLADCKRYCYKGYVIVETKTVCNGFEIKFRFRKPSWNFEFYKRASCLCIFGTYINWSKTYADKPVKVVYDPELI